MMGSHFEHCIFIWLVCVPSFSFKTIHEEPSSNCQRSRFDFEDKLLERSIQLAHDMKLLKEKVDAKLEELQIGKETMLKDIATLSKQLTTEQRSKNEQLTTLAEAVSNGFKEKIGEVDKELKEHAAAINDHMTLQQQQQIERMSSDLHKLANETLAKTRVEPVAFSVTSPTKKTVNDVPTFNTIITNIGDGYNKVTGKFTCPVAGVYQVSLTVHPDSGSANVYCRIRLNGSNKAIAQVYNSPHMSNTVTVLLLIQLNDVVDLGSCGGWNHIYTGAGFTVFSVVLISAT